MIRSLVHRPATWWLISLSWAGVIYWLSSQSDVPEPSFPLPPMTDKLVHALLYGILAAALYPAWRLTGLPPAKASVLAFVLASLYGMTDEWHQMSVEGRSPDLWDWVADTVGASAALLLGHREARRTSATPDATRAA